MVLCHECAHYGRGDCLWLPLLSSVRILYWWHPLVHLALARLLVERETACDDLVLGAEFRPSEYADLILGIAKSMQLGLINHAVAMASPCRLKTRIESIINPHLNRRPSSRTRNVATILVGLITGFIVMVVEVKAQTPVVPSAANPPEMPLNATNPLNTAQGEAEAIVIPKVSLTDVSLTDAFDAITTEAKKASPASHIKFILSTGAVKASEGKKITLSLVNTSVWEVLNYVSKCGGVTVSTTKETVSIVSESEVEEAISEEVRQKAGQPDIHVRVKWATEQTVPEKIFIYGRVKDLMAEARVLRVARTHCRYLVDFMTVENP